MPPPGAQKPMIGHIVILAWLRGFFDFVQVFRNLDTLNRYPSLYVPDWFKPANFIIFLLAVTVCLSAYLIAQYQRRGLYLGVVGFSGEFVLGLLILVSGEGANTNPVCGGVIPFAVDIFVLYYLYKYLNKSPQRDFFI